MYDQLGQIGDDYGRGYECHNSLVVVAVVPWLPLIALIILPFWILIRRALRSAPPQPVVLAPAEPPTPPENPS